MLALPLTEHAVHHDKEAATYVAVRKGSFNQEELFNNFSLALTWLCLNADNLFSDIANSWVA